MRTLLRIIRGNNAAPARVEQFAPPVIRSRLGAFWSACVAVRSNVPLPRYMDARLAFYDRSRPPYYIAELPVVIDGVPRLVPNDEPDPIARVLDDPAGVDLDPGASPSLHARVARWVRAAQQARGDILARDLEETERELQRVEARLRDTAEALEDRDAEYDKAIDVGIVLSPATRVRSAEGRGRPRVGRPWARPVLLAVEALFVGAEAYSFLPPILDFNGVVVPGGDVFALSGAQVLPSALLALVIAVASFTGIGQAVSAAIGHGGWRAYGKKRFAILAFNAHEK